MTTLVTTCRECGADYQPDRQTILRGEWKHCPNCRPAPTDPPDATSACERCGRVLRGDRTICLTCLGISAL